MTIEDKTAAEKADRKRLTKWAGGLLLGAVALSALTHNNSTSPTTATQATTYSQTATLKQKLHAYSTEMVSIDQDLLKGFNLIGPTTCSGYNPRGCHDAAVSALGITKSAHARFRALGLPDSCLENSHRAFDDVLTEYEQIYGEVIQALETNQVAPSTIQKMDQASRDMGAMVATAKSDINSCMAKVNAINS